MQRRRTAWLWRIGAVIGAALALTLVAWFDNEANRGVVREPRRQEGDRGHHGGPHGRQGPAQP